MHTEISEQCFLFFKVLTAEADATNNNMPRNPLTLYYNTKSCQKVEQSSRKSCGLADLDSFKPPTTLTSASPPPLPPSAKLGHKAHHPALKLQALNRSSICLVNANFGHYISWVYRAHFEQKHTHLHQAHVNTLKYQPTQLNLIAWPLLFLHWHNLIGADALDLETCNVDL